MTTSIVINGSIIEDATFLDCIPWPSAEPRVADIGIEVYASTRNNLLAECSRSPYFPTQEWWKRAKCSANTTSEIVRNYLNHKTLQFNSRTLFKESHSILHKISEAIRKNNCIEIILPAFCIISSWSKRHDTTSVTFAEEVSLLHLAMVAKTLEKNIGISLNFIIISDATFYAEIFGDPMLSAERYIRDLFIFTQRHGIDDSVQIVDMSDVIRPRRLEYENALSRNLEVFSNEPTRGISEEEAVRWKASVASTLNIADLELSYSQLRAIHCKGIFPRTTIKQEIEKRISRAFIHYRAMKQSLADIDWDRLAYKNALRGTIHHKTVPVIGVRIYPTYKSSCQLLPYHGIAVLNQKAGRCHMHIEHEIYLHDSPYIRVRNGDGASDFYATHSSLELALAGRCCVAI